MRMSCHSDIKEKKLYISEIDKNLYYVYEKGKVWIQLFFFLHKI